MGLTNCARSQMNGPRKIYYMRFKPYLIVNGKAADAIEFADTAELLNVPYVRAWLQLEDAKISKTPEGELMVSWSDKGGVRKETVIGRLDEYNGVQLPQWWTGWGEVSGAGAGDIKTVLETAQTSHVWPCEVEEYKPGMWRVTLVGLSLSRDMVFCMDCGCKNPQCPQIRDEVFYRWCPKGGRICLGCLETRMGRELVLGDLDETPRNMTLRTIMERGTDKW